MSPTSKVKKELLLLRQKGKCAGCGKSFKELRVKPIVHHVGTSDRVDMLQLLCPNCHSKAHHYKTRESDWGETETVIVRHRMGRGGKKKKAVRKKKKVAKEKKRTEDEEDEWEEEEEW
jgi:5-methylcytosine-specific restriction endonuclease McrA